MPGFVASPESIVNQIKSNLVDRYGSDSVLKELLQNADDAKASNFIVDALPGWPTAANLLLRGPGLLVANDGNFRPEDERGITSFGESAKSTDSGSIGKFGFGQKAVFHLCDAFAVCSYSGDRTFSTVVNPYLEVKLDGNKSESWEPKEGSLESPDVEILRRTVSLDMPIRHLILWIPFRRPEIEPAPGLGFSTDQPTVASAISEIDRPDFLRVILFALRNLKSIEIRENGKTRQHFYLSASATRLAGPSGLGQGTRMFNGAICTNVLENAAPFVGNEAMAREDDLSRLKQSKHWPKTISVSSPNPQPEKGEPHGAAFLLRSQSSAADQIEPGQLRISWAVFLPVSDESEIVIPLNFDFSGRLHLLLHGYFFLDSGRRRIEGLGLPLEECIPNNAEALRRKWNASLRDTVVLPLLPALFREALNSGMITSAELGKIIAVFTQDNWYKANRKAICRENSLVQVLEPTGGIGWHLVPAGARLRPIPDSVAETPTRFEELFPSISSWAENSSVTLVVGDSASLSAERMRWTIQELTNLFSGMTHRVFQSPTLAALLKDFLNIACLGDTERAAIAPMLLAALRKAIVDGQNLAPYELIRSILSFLPYGVLISLPKSVDSRQVLRALATAQASVLPVRSELFDDGRQVATIGKSDLKALLISLEPLIDDEQGDQAAIAALALLTRGQGNLSTLAADQEFAKIKVLRARNVSNGNFAILSLNELVQRSQQGLLFGGLPQNRKILPLLVNAAPDMKVLILEGNTYNFLQNFPIQHVRLQPPGKHVIYQLINRALQFGTVEARRNLIQEMDLSLGDDRLALRRLCAGVHEAGLPQAKLFSTINLPEGLERVIDKLLKSSTDTYSVAPEIDETLSPVMRKHIGIDSLDAQHLETLLARDVDAIAKFSLTSVECEALILTGISDPVLRRLPIHMRLDGTIGSADAVYREADWKIPNSLKPHVAIIKPFVHPKAIEVQSKLISAWSAEIQIEVALVQAEPQDFRSAILDALSVMKSPPSEVLCQKIRTRAWLVADKKPFKPEDMLSLPYEVDEEARKLLFKPGKAVLFLPLTKLAVDIREHRGFECLKDWILPGSHQSFEALSELIKEEKVIGFLGNVDDCPIDDFAILAKHGADVGLPAWPLFAAVLKSTENEREVNTVIRAFTSLLSTDADLAGRHLDCLALIAHEPKKVGEAAQRAYKQAFGIIIDWEDSATYRVFNHCRVPTASGHWRSGREVVQAGEGIDAAYVLQRDLASIMAKAKIGRLSSPANHDVHAEGQIELVAPDKITEVDLRSLEAKAVEQQKLFLDRWKGRIPSDLVILYLGIISRTTGFREIAEEWASDATASVDTIWDELDSKFSKDILYPGPLSAEIDRRRFQILSVTGQTVRAVALSGDEFNAPLGGANRGMLIGNLHKKGERIVSDGQVRMLISLPIRAIDPNSLSLKERIAVFRSHVETIAVECLWLNMEPQHIALEEILERSIKIDQATIEDSKLQLRDRLPVILGELKLPTTTKAHAALVEYQQGETRLIRLSLSADEKEELKKILWERISETQVTTELLSAVQCKIREFGYSPSRVLFELFQNADDAYQQFGDASADACFRIVLDENGTSGFRVIHWGRPINTLGRNATEGHLQGYDRDLQNMLVMNFSEKRQGDGLTGKFGLGFKSVHMLSDNVGIVSGFLALRIAGGLIPQDWPGGVAIGEAHKRPNGRKATIIDVPFLPEKMDNGIEALSAFQESMALLPAFSRSIRRVEIAGQNEALIKCTINPILEDLSLHVVSIEGRERYLCIRFELPDGFSLLITNDAGGPQAFPSKLKRLWNLAPLEESVNSAWLLNGPFAVDPGRGRLAGTAANRSDTFKKLGWAFGNQLLRLHDIVSSNWNAFANQLDLDTSGGDAEARFWSRLYDVLACDFDDHLASHLHTKDTGYGMLASKHFIVPTRLPAPMDSHVRGADITHYTHGSLVDKTVFEKMRHWPALANLAGQIVAAPVAGQLEKLGFGPMTPLTIAKVLRKEMGGQDNRIENELSGRLGHVVNLIDIEVNPLLQERQTILEYAKDAWFKTQSGTWRPVREVNCEGTGSDDETLLCKFAPEQTLLHRSYRGTALDFFQAARSQSGYGPQSRLILEWAKNADTRDRQRAALRYIIEGRQGTKLADEMCRSPPSWLPRPLERLQSDPLVQDWTSDDRWRLLSALGVIGKIVNPDQSEPVRDAMIDPDAFLRRLYDWWKQNYQVERRKYDDSTYPPGFHPRMLSKGQEKENFEGWFTFFALAIFRTIGLTGDESHRNFIVLARQAGWWQEMACATLPSDPEPWIKNLEDFASSDVYRINYPQWRRVLADLYVLRRWLPEYIDAYRNLPKVLRVKTEVSLRDFWRLSSSEIWQARGLEAAPLTQSLGIGANWLIREGFRANLWDEDDKQFLVKYGWSSSGKVRKLFRNYLGLELGEASDMDLTQTLHQEVERHLGQDAVFLGDLDLPLQIISDGKRADLLFTLLGNGLAEPRTQRFFKEPGYD